MVASVFLGAGVGIHWMAWTEGPVPRACSFSTRFFMAKRPRTMVWIGSAVHCRPCQGEIFECDWVLASSMVQRRFMSTIALSALEPTVSVPLRGYSPQSLAGL